MTISELGDIGDFIASVGVIASLIFVGMQMRTNAKLMRAAAVQGSADFFTQAFSMEFAKNPELNRIWLLLERGSWNDLSDLDRGACLNILNGLLNTCDRIHVQMQEGIVPVEYWHEVRGWMRHQLLTLPLVREYWERVIIPAGMYSAAFREEITREIATVGDRRALTPWTQPAPHRSRSERAVLT